MPARKQTMSGTMASFFNAVRPGSSNKNNNNLTVPTSAPPVPPLKYDKRFSTSAQFSNATSLHGKVAVVTGSSRSIGAAIAICLGEHGANVVVNYVSDTGASTAASIVQTIRSQGKGGAISVRADAATIDGGKILLDEAMKTFGRIDILVLNSGLMGSGTLDEMDEPFFDAQFDANVKAPLFMAKNVAPLLPQGGRIIFFSSTLTQASTVQANSLCYLATKGAIEQACRVLAKDLGGKGITVNTVSPGPIDTPLFREGKSQAVLDAIAKQSPGRRLGEPEDVAPLVAFLVSPAAQWINGQNIRVDGGYVV